MLRRLVLTLTVLLLHLNGSLQLVLIHSISKFFDIQVSAYTSVDRTVSLGTSMYRTPGFVPHYLPSLSDHPCPHKSGIFKCEWYRAMPLSGTEGVYNTAIVDLFGFLENAGYPPKSFSKISCDPTWRARALLKLGSRKKN